MTKKHYFYGRKPITITGLTVGPYFGSYSVNKNILQIRGMESQANNESDESDEFTSGNPYDRTDNYKVNRSSKYVKEEETRVIEMKESVRNISSK